MRAYLNKGVEKEKIDFMLRAGMAAPTGRDIRPWEFVVVSDRAKLDSMAAALPYAKMLTQARNAIIVCGDSVRSSYWYLDCSAAAQNILLAAESLGKRYIIISISKQKFCLFNNFLTFASKLIKI